MIKIALLLGLTEEEAGFARRVGLSHAVWGGPDTGKGCLDLETLQRALDFFGSHGLELGVIENVPVQFYDQVMLGLPGRDRQIENFCRTLENMGQVGIPVLGYHWMALGGITTDYVHVRGGALSRHFNLQAALKNPAASLEWRGPATPNRPIHLPDLEISTEAMWENLAYFLERVLPVAESAGVKLAAHPDDAPIPSFMGIARILSSLAGLQHLLDLYPSPSNGLDFCQGTIAEMPEVDVLAAIRHFGSQGKIFFAHFRNTHGVVPQFTEVFMDEGDLDMVAAMQAYHEVGYSGLIRADHTPRVWGDNRYAQRGFAFEIGYMQSLLNASQFQRIS
jgi:mannonate dehydratase